VNLLAILKSPSLSQNPKPPQPDRDPPKPVNLTATHTTPTLYTGPWCYMPFQKRSIRWLDCNDMLILYEDGGASMSDLSARFKVDKKRVLAILHALGATIRSKGGAARTVEIEREDGDAPAPITFRSKSTYEAFMTIQGWLSNRGIDGEVGSAGVGNG